MAKHGERQPRGGRPVRVERAPGPLPADDPVWYTAITRIQPNEILVRGYPLDELMGRYSFAECIYLILRGELPSPTIGKLFAAALVASIDHGVTPPSTIAARNVATSGAKLRVAVASGVLGFGAYHGGDIEGCMRFLHEGLARVREGATYSEAAQGLVRSCVEAARRPPGFGHRIHTADPRATRLLQLAHDLELDGEYIQLVRTIERVAAARPDAADQPWPINLDGAIAAVCGDLGFEPELGNAVFLIARIPGLVAHANEERARQHPMRLINPRHAAYDGPPPRRLPETRK